MAGKKILMLVGDFVEDTKSWCRSGASYGRAHGARRLRRKEGGEKVRTAIHDFEGDQTYSEKPGHNFTLNATFSEVKPESYDALVVPGGRAPEYIRLNADVIKAVQHFAAAKKPIAAICHGAQLLAAAGAVGGKRCSAYPAVGPDVTRAGGTYADIPLMRPVWTGTWSRHPPGLRTRVAGEVPGGAGNEDSAVVGC